MLYVANFLTAFLDDSKFKSECHIMPQKINEPKYGFLSKSKWFILCQRTLSQKSNTKNHSNEHQNNLNATALQIVLLQHNATKIAATKYHMIIRKKTLQLVGMPHKCHKGVPHTEKSCREGVCL
jgi:hypothetical protein